MSKDGWICLLSVGARVTPWTDIGHKQAKEARRSRAEAASRLGTAMWMAERWAAALCFGQVSDYRLPFDGCQALGVLST